NVVLDVLQARSAFVEDAVSVFDMVERNAITGLLCATTITTLAYLAGKTVGKSQATRQIRALLALFEVAPVTRAVLDRALKSKATDFEDAVLAEAALLAGADAIITRNLRDFTHSPVRAHTPAQWIAMRPR
ncbi:MAG: PIN domain-containing protein, partial [Betaproteobacteria bacterium]